MVAIHTSGCKAGVTSIVTPPKHPFLAWVYARNLGLCPLCPPFESGKREEKSPSRSLGEIPELKPLGQGSGIYWHVDLKY